ncbi:DUF1874 domain-containing protein [Pyrinomonas sp.]|uniref:STIV orfB116 family protein n=1 Tax=Pyrinomonas sp. TaxID=2080306 RepID=UPI0033292B64
MPVLTVKAQIHTDPETEAILRDAMYCATKVYDGLMWHLRQKQEETGKARISRSNLNRILATLPRAVGVGEAALVFRLKRRIPEGKVLNRREIEEVGYEFGLLTRTFS